MPVDVALNTFIRNSVRRDLQLPRPAILGLVLPFEEDTSDESIRLFREAGVVPTRADQAAAARAAEEEALRQLGPRPGGILAFTQTTAVAGTSWVAAVTGPVPIVPFLIDTFSVNVQSAAGAPGGLQSNVFAILISSTPDLTLSQLQADIPAILAGDGFSDGIAFARLRTTGQSSETINVPINFAVPLSPAFVKFLSIPAANSTLAATASITQLAAFAGITPLFFAPAPGRTTININTAGAPRRGTRTPTPRAAVISVTGGGTILNQRTVAWESLRSPIRADWFNRQVGGVGDPSIRWIP